MKERITVSIDIKLLNLVDRKIDSFIFASRSHGFEAIVAEEFIKERTKKKSGKDYK